MCGIRDRQMFTVRAISPCIGDNYTNFYNEVSAGILFLPGIDNTNFTSFYGYPDNWYVRLLHYL